MEENKQVVAEWKALNQPRLQEIKKANPDLYSAVNLALQYLNQKLGGEELPAEIEVVEDVVETTPIQTKQWTLDDFKDTKIVVDTPGKSQRFQELLFSLGIAWSSVDVYEESKRDTAQLTDRKYLTVTQLGDAFSGYELVYINSKDTFYKSDKKIIFYDDIFPPLTTTTETETKQWTLDDFENIKIIVDTPEKSLKFQELFLSLGGEWSRIDNPNPTKPAHLDKAYLVSNGTKLLFFDNYPAFEEQTSLKEIFYDDIFPGETETSTQQVKTTVEESTPGGQYKWPIETYPPTLKYPSWALDFKKNNGDRKSPTQSAGELKRRANQLGQASVAIKMILETKFKGNDGNWYAINVGKNDVWTWKETTAPPTPQSTSFTSTATSIAQPVATTVTNYKPSDLIGWEIFNKSTYKILGIIKVNPKTIVYRTMNNLKEVELVIPKTAINDLLEGKIVGKAFLKDFKPVQTPVQTQTQTQSTSSNSFEDSLTSLSDDELKQLYDDAYEARKEFIITEPEYLELSQQIVAIGNEIDNRNI